MKSETRFRNSVVAPFLKTLKNTYVEPIQQCSIRGSADYILCCFGTFVWLELKDMSGKLRPLQAWKADQVKKARGVPLVATQENWQQIKTILQKLDEGEL